LAEKTVFELANGLLMICLEHDLRLILIRAMADTKPERIVCLDEGFAGNDQLKTKCCINSQNKGINSFKTV
jgi:adenine-specific DNA-methyltransferase